MLRQHGGRVELRIERHRDEPNVGEVGRLADVLLHCRELPVHQRTEVGQRTSRVDERQRDAVAAQRSDRARRARLIDQRVVGDDVALLEQIGIGDRRDRPAAVSSGARPVVVSVDRYALTSSTTSVAVTRSPGCFPSSSAGSCTL